MQAATELDLATNDLGPLAWVLDELRKSLESASSALRRFVRDATLARGQDMASVDTGQLRIARQQLHQAVGALEMVGLAPPAQILRSMEAAVQKFVDRPELCTEAAAAKLERAGFALTEYLEAVLLGKPVSAVALFPQYKDVQELAGADRVHPADLSALDWRWIDPATPAVAQPLVYDAAVRSRMDQAVLRIVKSADPLAGRDLAEVSLALAETQAAKQPKVFWKIAAGYFEAIANKLLPADIYVKRAASRVLLQYASLAKGEVGVSDRLAQDLAFFCAQAVPQPGTAPALDAVRQAYGLARYPRIDYTVAQFGRFDPVILAQARKRMGHAKETWSALSGGEAAKLKGIGDHFRQLTEALIKLYPTCANLAQALNTVVESVARSGRPPAPELAMEVATSVLYLEAALQDLDTDDAQILERTESLAARLAAVIGGGPAGPLDHWMEELYRRVSDRQTMGSVVGELRGTLGELEKLLDQFFRNTAEKAPLRNAPSHLLQMRGVLSVLGLDQAAHAVGRMRETIDQIMMNDVDEAQARAAGTFDRLGNNLGALGFLIDMLSYQPTLAKKLFVYDEKNGELKPLMGRAAAPAVPPAAPEVAVAPPAIVPAQAAQPAPAPVQPAARAPQGAAGAAAQPAASPVQAPAQSREAAQPAAPVAQPAPVAKAPAVAAATAAPVAAQPAAPVAAPAAPVAVPAAAAPAELSEEDAELLEIFLEEAREVVGTGSAAIAALASNPGDISELTTLRRAFHTLKGSSRMVGLNEFGEAGWSFEQVLNTWLADQKPATPDLCTLCTRALEGFGRWAEDIAANSAGAWKASMFRVAADAMRNEQRLVELKLPGAGTAPVEAQPQPPVAAVDAQPAVAADVAAAHVPQPPEAAATESPHAVSAVPPGIEAQPIEPAIDSEIVTLDAASMSPVMLDLAPAQVPEVQQPATAADAPSLDDFDFDLSAPPAADAPADAAAAQTAPTIDLPADFFDAPAPATVEPVAAQAVLPEPEVTAEVPQPAAELPETPAPDFDFEATQVVRAQPEITFEAPQPAAPEITFDAPQVAAPQPAAPEISFEPSPAAHAAQAEPQAPARSETPAPAFDATQVIRVEPAAAAEIPIDELPPEFDFDFAAGAPAQPASAQAPAIEMPADIAGIDFGSLEAVSGAAFSVESDASTDVTASQPQPEAAPEAATDAEAEAEAERARGDEQVKVIGTLRISIPLYNVYLNEADEWSRRLSTEVSEWALQMEERVADSTVGWAHALAGSSATVGFQALSDVARALEHSLEHAQGLAYGTPQHSTAFSNAAEEIRRLLHQFAAGFLKEPDSRVVAALVALQDLEIPERADVRDSEQPADVRDSEQPADALADFDFGDVEVVEAAAMPVEPEPARPAAVEPFAGAVAEPVAPAAAEPVAPQMTAPVAEPMSTDAAAAFAQPAEVAALPVVSSGTFASANTSLEGDEDIDVADAIDPDLFPIFEEEAIELMPQLGGALRQWAARPENDGARNETLRVLHTLKGSARLAGALRLGEMAHRLESEVQYLGMDDLKAADIEQLLHRFDGLQARFDALRTVGSQPEVVQSQTAVTVPAQPEAVLAALRSEAPHAEQAAGVTPARPSDGEQPGAAAETPKPAAARVAAPQPLQVRQDRGQQVRVRSQLLDRLVNQAGEVMITRSRLEAELKQLRTSLADLTTNLDRLRGQLREIEVQAETQMQSRIAQAKEVGAGFDPLEFDRFTRTQELTRFMAESVNDIATVQRNIQRVVAATEDDLIAQARQTRELQRDLLRTRMVEFEGISDRLYRVVRLAAKESGKLVKLDIVGGSIEMDRGVLDRMTPAFEHLLRNCVAHGVEDPAVRTAAGKDAAGTIVVTVAQEGNDVSVAFSDDGAGLNIARIREKAVQQGMIAADQQITDAEAANLIFMPGFSTAAQVTELAGRGIGMDVVRSEVTALGGRIETTTRLGQGSSFKLVLPLTTAVTQVVMIRSGKLAVGVPANLVELVRRATIADLQKAYDSGTFEFNGEQVPFFWSGALLQSSPRSVEPHGKTVPVVIFRSAAQRAAVHVDEVLGNQEVVVKNLGPQLSRLPGLAGMTVLASGAVVLIYNPVALTQVYGEQARALTAPAAAESEPLQNVTAAQAAAAVVAAASEGLASPPINELIAEPPQIPLVLVVDDSITVRRVTQRLLQREGYRVALAADGLQALEKLAEERPAVMLSDIEMPRMDGFDLARNVRADDRLKDLPIVMITSRIAEKHKEHARELGVNHYLGKPYSEEELMSLVKHYCTQAQPAAAD